MGDIAEFLCFTITPASHFHPDCVICASSGRAMRHKKIKKYRSQKKVIRLFLLLRYSRFVIQCSIFQFGEGEKKRKTNCSASFHPMPNRIFIYYLHYYYLNSATGDDEEPQDIAAERLEDFEGFIYW
jgi:hypothetical protein